MFLRVTGIAGTLPWSIGYLTHMTSFDVAYNRFSSTVPTSIGTFATRPNPLLNV